MEPLNSIEIPKDLKTGMICPELKTDSPKIALIEISPKRMKTFMIHVPQKISLIDLSTEKVIFQYKGGIISSWLFYDINGDGSDELLISNSEEHNLMIIDQNGALLHKMEFNVQDNFPADILPLKVAGYPQKLLITGHNSPLYIYDYKQQKAVPFLTPPAPLNTFGFSNDLLWHVSPNDSTTYLIVHGTQPKKFFGLIKQNRAFSWIYKLKNGHNKEANSVETPHFEFIGTFPLDVIPKQTAIISELNQFVIVGDNTTLSGYNILEKKRVWEHNLLIWPFRLLSIPSISHGHFLNHKYLVLAGQFLFCIDIFGKRLFKARFKNLADIQYVSPESNKWHRHLLVTSGKEYIEIYALS